MVVCFTICCHRVNSLCFAPAKAMRAWRLSCCLPIHHFICPPLSSQAYAYCLSYLMIENAVAYHCQTTTCRGENEWWTQLLCTSECWQKPFNIGSRIKGANYAKCFRASVEIHTSTILIVSIWCPVFRGWCSAYPHYYNVLQLPTNVFSCYSFSVLFTRSYELPHAVLFPGCSL